MPHWTEERLNTPIPDPSEHLPAVRIEHSRTEMRVRRLCDNRVLIACAMSDDAVIESIADTLSAHRMGLEAMQVRRLLYGGR